MKTALYAPSKCIWIRENKIPAHDLKDIVFNPQTGLFENARDPTAHLTTQELRCKRAKQRETDPLRAKMKPRINFFRCFGDECPTVGEQIILAWNVGLAECVRITFPDNKTVPFLSVDKCMFTMPSEECLVRLIAINGKYKTQLTMRIKPRKRFGTACLKNISMWLRQIHRIIHHIRMRIV